VTKDETDKIVDDLTNRVARSVAGQVSGSGARFLLVVMLPHDGGAASTNMAGTVDKGHLRKLLLHLANDQVVAGEESADDPNDEDVRQA